MVAFFISSRSHRSTRLGAATAILAAAVLAPLLSPAVASAHDALVGTAPAEGETVQTLPDEVTLTFSGSLLQGAPQAVFVTDASCPGIVDAEPGRVTIDRDACHDYAAGDAVAAGPMLRQKLDATGAPAGEYTVIASVTYGDSHSEDKIFRFTTTEAADGAPSATPEPTMTTQAEPAPSATAAPSAAAEEGTPADGDSFQRNLPWIIGGVVLVAGGGALVAALLARSRRSS
ncbi:copper resistance protein CopC [Microbacterium oryzae]|uniref:copper resistance CopC family protein n=1 Tax=Microbacterium oryzae TaxID=743009 RepID=UPI0025B1EF04|nr:copper resistance protein CopC [Microbacterium oryzae]MDN3311921.1 copper resistance protein CopC [Microbacterium oryzae]